MRPIMQTGDEHTDDREDEHRVQSRCRRRPEITSPSCIRNSGTKPPSGVIESSSSSPAPVDVAVVTRREQRGRTDAVARFLAFHVAAGLVAGSHLIDALRSDERIAELFAAYRPASSDPTSMIPIAASTAHPWRVSPTMRPNV